jgi:hypothetical protein
MLIVLAAVLAMAYVTFFTDWFRSEPIRLSHRFFAGGRGNSAGGRWTFYVQPKQPISTLNVFRASDVSGAKPKSLWHMVSGSKPVPIEAFDYGERIPGMKPFVAGTAPEPLLPGEEYIVRVEMGKKHGEMKFAVPTN